MQYIIHSRNLNSIIPLFCYLFLIVVVSGCSSIDYPVWLGDEGVSDMCDREGTHSFTHDGITREFEVRLIQPENMAKNCGSDRNGFHANACIIQNKTIYVSPGRRCPEQMAHELSHGFGMHFVDRPLVRGS